MPDRGAAWHTAPFVDKLLVGWTADARVCDSLNHAFERGAGHYWRNHAIRTPSATAGEAEMASGVAGKQVG